MPVKSLALPHEKSSPFYIHNKEKCETFDDLIVSLNGETRGRYNAWSYDVIGKVRHPNKWQFRIKRTVHGSTGNLFLSSKTQTLDVIGEWIAQIESATYKSFVIRKKRWLDFLRPRRKKFRNYENYVIMRISDRRHFKRIDKEIVDTNFGIAQTKDLMDEIHQVVMTLFALGSIREVKFKKGVLRVYFESESILENKIKSILKIEL